MPLFLDVQPGDVVRIGADTRVTIEHKRGQRTRLRIEAAAPVHVERPDVAVGAGAPAPPRVQRSIIQR